jgi:IS30 family transposase
MQNYIYPTQHKRNEVQLHDKGFSVRDITRTLGRGKTTISNELNRSKVNDEYLASKAHAKANG